eukprot:362378-Chlamydomonas_euryale.AAC.2
MAQRGLCQTVLTRLPQQCSCIDSAKMLRSAAHIQNRMVQRSRAFTAVLRAGLDSLGSVELRNSLQARLGVDLPPTLVFDYPSASAIAAHVADRISTQAQVGVGGVWAVSGVGCGLPGFGRSRAICCARVWTKARCERV